MREKGGTERYGNQQQNNTNKNHIIINICISIYIYIHIYTPTQSICQHSRNSTINNRNTM